MTPTILIIDDEEAARYGIARALKNYSIVEASNVEQAKKINTHVDLILLDINLPGMSGLDYLRELVKVEGHPPVIIITAHGSERTAVDALKAGAYDYLSKPFELDELRSTVKNALEASNLRRENQSLKEELKAVRGFGDMLGSSDRMVAIYNTIDRVAATDVSVLINGESGTGKELVARAIHERTAHRRNGQFIAMNCAALPSELIESELFGHEKGSFTGAVGMRKGKFELAHGGTIFLDEIGDMSLNTQAKLLRVLEERKIERLGGSHSIPVNVRVVSATNRDLDSWITTEKFRPDLYYRLRVVRIDLPPLRERRSDIPMLARHFLKSYSTRYKLHCTEISNDALSYLVAYDWPGNVRELRNVIEAGAVLAAGASLHPDDLSVELKNRASNPSPDVIRHELAQPNVIRHEYTQSPQAQEQITVNTGDNLQIPFLDDFREARREFERAYIERVLLETSGNVTRAAERVGMHRQSLQQKLKDLGLTRRYVIGDQTQDLHDS